MSTVQLMQGDCLELLKTIPDGSVDMVLADLPYGTTACKWDSIIPLETLWVHYRRICKPQAAIVLTASQPFTTKLIHSNMEMFKYCWVWEKTRATGYFDVNYRPMKNHEDICVFGMGGVSCGSDPRMSYYPQGTQLLDAPKKRTRKAVDACSRSGAEPKGEQTVTGYPKSVLAFPSATKTVHHTQKPTELMKYLIKTYTLEGQTVLDNTMGSGTTGVACVRTNRNFIGMELDQKFFDLAKDRITKEQT